jgi:hypothetical protein
MVVLSIYSGKTICIKQYGHFIVGYAPRSCMNKCIHKGMMFVICSTIRMSELKYIVSFIIVLSILAMKDVMLEYDLAHNALNNRFSPNICVP